MDHHIITRKAILLAGIACLLCCGAGYARNPPYPPALPAASGNLFGKIVDGDTAEPLGWTQLLIEALNRSITAHEDGTFHFFNLPPGVYTLKTFRVGYQDRAFTVAVTEGDTTDVTLKLTGVPVAGKAVVVEGDKADLLSALTRADVEVSGKKLRQNLGRTIAETIDSEPGISQRTLGPAPARPVLRGLGGDRLLVLEDGERTGDLSATASDHAVVIEPLAAERIEVIRGPEALLYGPGSLGGVINVARGYVPATLAHHVNGAVSLQGESVNRGYSGGAFLNAPLGPLSVRMDGSYRDARDIATPLGELSNTSIRTLNGSAGASLVRSWGYAGASGSLYESEYGIPPDPVAGHPGGVRIDLNRRHLESKAELLPRSGWIRRLTLRHGFTRYRHSEIEYSERLGREIAGTGFDVLTHHLSAMVRFNQSGTLRNGALGVWGEFRDHSTPSGRNLTPRSNEFAGAVFAYQEANWQRFAVNGALRFDIKQVEPQENRGASTEAGRVRERSFQGVSGAVSGIYQPWNGIYLGATMLRSFRAPGIEELFSVGPHLAVYTYEVGNADLTPERGVGLEGFLEVRQQRGHLRVAAFRNDINHYIFPENTGQRSSRIYSLFEYRFSGKNALLSGIEGAFDWQLLRHWYAGGTVSYVQGELRDSGEPLPRIPPLEGKLSLRYQAGQFSLGGGMNAAAAQDRIGRFETATPGYLAFSLFGQYNFSAGGCFHTLSLNAGNLLDSEYRRHLNWVKHIMPEPGRNVRLLYKMFF